LIAFRGTSGLKDWFTDLSFWPAWSLPLRHQGFEWTWQGVKPQVEAWLKEVTARLGQPPTIYLTGHSLAEPWPRSRRWTSVSVTPSPGW